MLHRRETDMNTDQEFRAMIQQLCDDVPINTDSILRSNRAYIERYLALGAEQSSDSWNAVPAQDDNALD